MYILDFYCPGARLAVELDGGLHDEAIRADYDAARTQALQRAGIRVIRFRNEQLIGGLDEVCQQILAAALAFERGAQQMATP